VLTAYYDLAVSPPTYDFVSFLLHAEMRRLDACEDSVEIRVLPGPNGGFREDRLPPQDIPTRCMMRDAIVAPMSDLLPSCAGCTVQSDRANGAARSFGHNAKCYGLGYMVRAAQANCYPLQSPHKVPGEYVTITLRECAYHPTRNSNLAEWRAVARHLRAEGHSVVIVRDTERAHEPLEDLTTSPRAAVDVLYRAALYAGASLNLFVSNGPAWLSLFLGAPTAIFKLLAPGVKMARPETFARVGLPVGSPWPNLRLRQHVSWADDNAKDILPVAERLLACA